MAKRKTRELPPIADRRKWEVWNAAEQIWAENVERVALRNVWARVKRNAGTAGNNQCVGEHLSQWMEFREYSSIIETAKMPEAVQDKLAKAGVEVWKAAQAEAATIFERDRIRMAEAIQAERDLRSEALGMLDARDLVIEHQQTELAWYAGELERMKEHLEAERLRMEGHVADVRSIAFWRRVAHEIWELLPDRDPLPLKEIADRVSDETKKEAEGFPGEWGPELLRGVMDQRIKFKKLFAKQGAGRYRRRRPEDDDPAGLEAA